jgi:HTH-type transcriptional regulator/antitoxin HigA
VAAKINQKKYAELLAKIRPSLIDNVQEKQRILAEIDRLMSKGEEALTPEEEKVLILMSKLVQDYETEHYRIKAASPHIILQELMEANSLRQRDLLHIFGSRGIASEVVNGQRNISKRQARLLGNFFHVSPELFLWGEEQESDLTQSGIAAKQSLPQTCFHPQMSFTFMVEARSVETITGPTYSVTTNKESEGLKVTITSSRKSEMAHTSRKENDDADFSLAA